MHWHVIFFRWLRLPNDPSSGTAGVRGTVGAANNIQIKIRVKYKLRKALISCMTDVGNQRCDSDTEANFKICPTLCERKTDLKCSHPSEPPISIFFRLTSRINHQIIPLDPMAVRYPIAKTTVRRTAASCANSNISRKKPHETKHIGQNKDKQFV